MIEIYKTNENNELEELEAYRKLELNLEKLLKYGFDINENANNEKYKFVSCDLYYVDDNFPRLSEKDIHFQEIGKVTYELFISTLERFKKEN